MNHGNHMVAFFLCRGILSFCMHPSFLFFVALLSDTP